MVQICSIDEFKRIMDQNAHVFLVDCRTQEEFDSGHIPRAIHIPLGSDLAQFEWPDNQPIYVICHSGARSEAFCEELMQLGKEAINLKGGMREWNGV